MNLADLSKPIDSKTVSKLLKKQFGKEYKVETMSLKEAVLTLNKTDRMLEKFRRTNNLFESYNNETFLRVRMFNEAVEKRAAELIQNLQESTMNKKFSTALKIAAKGGILSEEQLKALRLSEDLESVLRSAKTAKMFMQKIVESRRAKKLMEGEIEQAQTTIAAKDISDQIQSMIEKFADIKYKELPALHDSIRDSQGLEIADQFTESVNASLDTLTQALEQAKKDIDHAIGLLTGETTELGGDLDIEDLEGTEEEPGGEEPEGEEFELNFEPEEEEGEEVEVGRERR